MWDPETETFSFARFEKRYATYRRGAIPLHNSLVDFIEQFDPDFLPQIWELFDEDLKATIRNLFEHSPQTEEEWAEIGRRQQFEAKQLADELRHRSERLSWMENWKINERDGAWYIPKLEIGCPRYLVYPIRRICNLPTHEGDWDKWRQKHDSVLSSLGLIDWVYENRNRWYCYLSSGHVGSYRYSTIPRRESFPLRACEREPNGTTIDQLNRRLQFINVEYPLYFFNVRRQIRDWIDRLRQFA